jgi:hypothetical protein
MAANPKSGGKLEDQGTLHLIRVLTFRNILTIDIICRPAATAALYVTRSTTSAGTGSTYLDEGGKLSSAGG